MNNSASFVSVSNPSLTSNPTKRRRQEPDADREDKQMTRPGYWISRKEVQNIDIDMIMEIFARESQISKEELELYKAQDVKSPL